MRIATIILSLLLGSVVLHAQNTERAIKEVFAGIAGSPVGLTAVVVKGGKVVMAYDLGYADQKRKVPVDANTQFNVGSIAKQFTGLAVKALIDQGKVSLNDPVTKYFEGLPEAYDAVLIKHLLRHSGGILSPRIPAMFKGKRRHKNLGRKQVMQHLQSTPQLNFRPGDVHVYSNLGYILLGWIVEDVSGKPLPQAIRELVCAPAGIEGERWLTEERDAAANGYWYWKRFKRVKEKPDDLGYSNLWMDRQDMSDWMIHLLSLEKDKKLSALLSPVSLLNGGLNVYNYGLFQSEHQGVKTIEHGGKMPGFVAHMRLLPDHDLGIAVFANYNGVDAQYYVDKLTDIYTGNTTDTRIPQVFGSILDSTGKAMPFARVYVDTNLGPAVSNDAGRFQIASEAYTGELFVKVGGQTFLLDTVIENAPNKFRLPVRRSSGFSSSARPLRASFKIGQFSRHEVVERFTLYDEGEYLDSISIGVENESDTSGWVSLQMYAAEPTTGGPGRSLLDRSAAQLVPPGKHYLTWYFESGTFKLKGDVFVGLLWPTREKGDAFIQLLNGEGDTKRGQSHTYLREPGGTWRMAHEFEAHPATPIIKLHSADRSIKLPVSTRSNKWGYLFDPLYHTVRPFMIAHNDLLIKLHPDEPYTRFSSTSADTWQLDYNSWVFKAKYNADGGYILEEERAGSPSTTFQPTTYNADCTLKKGKYKFQGVNGRFRAKLTESKRYLIVRLGRGRSYWFKRLSGNFFYGYQGSFDAYVSVEEMPSGKLKLLYWDRRTLPVPFETKKVVEVER